MEYVLVQWPESQMLMEESWFDECFLANPTNDEQEWVGSSAYFVPKERYNEFITDSITECILDKHVPGCPCK